MNGLALCAGVGGLELGLHLALGDDYQTVCWVEHEGYAAATLVARMADASLVAAPVWSDVATFDGEPWRGVVDIVTGGFPCQPWSTAGKRLGTADERWIWDDIARIVREVGPAYVFLENVPGLADGGLEHVLGTLAEMGFDAEWDLFPASEAGAPHRRERLFILAHCGPVGRRAHEHGLRTREPDPSRGRCDGGHYPTPDAGVTTRSNRSPSPGATDRPALAKLAPNLMQSAPLASARQTPTATDMRRGLTTGSGYLTGDVADMTARLASPWATPTVQDAKNRAGPSQFDRNTQPLNVQVISRSGRPDETTTPAGRVQLTSEWELNPRFVEWLMGMPIGWTDYARPVTALSPWLQRMRSLLFALGYTQTGVPDGI